MTQRGNARKFLLAADGNSTTLDSVGLTFDAFDRMVEQNRSGAYTQIVYSPTGFKMQIFANGQSTPAKNFVPLPGGATVVYPSAGPVYIRHPDWLGSSRFATTGASRTMYFDTAYAPFGEPYASTGATDLSFTGQNQDTTSGTNNSDYDFLYREYSFQGRWAQPDPAGLAAVDPSNPQSWNRYAYVFNNPLLFIDPLGLSSNCNTVENRDPNDLNQRQDSRGGPFVPEPAPQHPSGGCGHLPGGGFFDDGSWTLDGGYVGDDSGLDVGVPIGNGDTTGLAGIPAWAMAYENGDWHWELVNPYLFLVSQLSSEDPSSGVLGGRNAKIGPGDPNGKKNYCLDQAHQAGLEELLPGISRGQYVSTAAKIGAETGGHLALDAAAASSLLKRAIRAKTGIPMSITEKALGWFAVILGAYSGYEFLKASRDEYQACMAY